MPMVDAAAKYRLGNYDHHADGKPNAAQGPLMPFRAIKFIPFHVRPLRSVLAPSLIQAARFHGVSVRPVHVEAGTVASQAGLARK